MSIIPTKKTLTKLGFRIDKILSLLKTQKAPLLDCSILTFFIREMLISKTMLDSNK